MMIRYTQLLSNSYEVYGYLMWVFSQIEVGISDVSRYDVLSWSLVR